MPDIILMGPVGTGKTTLATLISERLHIPHYSLDEIRYQYYQEIGYEEEVAKKIRDREGFLGIYRYWKLFEAYAVKRFLSDYRNCVFDFGGGHSVYEDEGLFNSVKQILQPYKNVILILPSPDLDESIQILNERNGGIISNGVDFNEHFVKHHSNHDLAKITVYTKNKTPQETCNEILSFL